MKKYIQYTMKKKLKVPPSPLVIPNKPMDLEKLMNYKINKEDETGEDETGEDYINHIENLKDNYKYYVRIICLNISKYFILDYNNMELCFNRLIKENINDFYNLFKEAEELTGPRQSFLYTLDEVMFSNLHNFQKNYFVKYNLEFDGWWFYCDNCTQYACCDTTFNPHTKTRTHICNQCKYAKDYP